jgi:hypothetical protein
MGQMCFTRTLQSSIRNFSTSDTCEACTFCRIVWNFTVKTPAAKWAHLV